MATWMKLWLGLTVSGMALVAVLLLPPDPPAARYLTGAESLDRRVRLLENEFDSYLAAAQYTRWSDSLSAMAVSTAEEGVILGYPISDELEPTAVEAHRRWTVEEIETLDRRSDVLFGYFHQFVDHASVVEMDQRKVRNFSGRKQTYVGERDGQAYCLQVKPVSPNRFVRDFDTNMENWQKREAAGERIPSNYLGLCRNYVRFGMAGPQIQEWLEAGAYSFLQRQGDGGVLRTDGDIEWQLRRGLFGMGGYSVGNRDLVEPDLCAVGDTEACLASVIEPDLLFPGELRAVKMSPIADIGTSQGYGSPYHYLDDYMMYDLEAEFGTDAFAAFWTSEAPVEDAFQDAFGTDFGSWVQSWVHRHTGKRVPGPGLPRSDFFLAVFTLSLFGAATSLRKRRSVT